MANSWTYWWFNTSGRSNGIASRVNFYGQSAGPLLSVPNPDTAMETVHVFPNPASNGWRLAGNGSFWLFDNQGRLLQHGPVTTATTISTVALVPGMYLLQFRTSTGTISYQKLIRE
ncbi:T9SS type A sorting domain-containing protein [Hymenobacter puniceus]|uniref:T9SS type A sorting domain-containing protein n=1 Tax=Hymenobacter sp. BT190 TaxID=2763505 RepID=UPI001650E889|nr:T9SS type A sorting domain-containing protein [Hymenobacter sp. BT190]MBC6696997.1 T9SS type A sorting domain-containing protein [Hymenobacter sp. BT190]